jgi:hypothetical protein
MFFTFLGTNQPGKGFYARIYKYFVENGLHETSRTANSVALRWGNIQKAVNKFSGIFSMVCRRNESGKTEQDRVLIVFVQLHIRTEFATLFDIEPLSFIDQ